MTTETKFKCTCPSCDKDFYFSRSNLGKKAKCSKCSSVFRVTPDEMSMLPPVEQPVFTPVQPVERPVFTPVPHFEQEPPVAAAQNITHIHNNYYSDKKSKAFCIVVWLFFGGIGLHRFYIGDIGTGLLLLGSCFLILLTAGVWLPIHVMLVVLDGVLLLFDRRPCFSKR